MTRYPNTLVCLLSVAAASSVGVPALAQEQWLVLDCPVSKSNPALDIADLPVVAAAVRLERYRFAIPLAGGAGVATTIRASDIPARVLASDTQFQIDFENRRVVIDRMTAEFQVAMSGARISLGGGSCVKLEQRKF